MVTLIGIHAAWKNGGLTKAESLNVGDLVMLGDLDLLITSGPRRVDDDTLTVKGTLSTGTEVAEHTTTQPFTYGEKVWVAVG